ncbi:SprT family protein [Paenibacillus thermotolerans]|uniref:SprT family protein n=1 Tax=Paenibacillus thermotolerans TaxID=3027807 RepID=UPI0023678D42|nr:MULTISPECIES: SprT family protein [unclassified Paenibacillus]
MTDAELQQWVERVSMESFGRPFVHRATFNSRLRTTGGRYLLRSHNIEINRKQYDTYGAEETEKIIKHELCHYHLHLLRRGYRHSDRDFQELLAKVGGSRFCQAVPGSIVRLPVRYKLVCRSCGTEYPRKRKADPRRYRCGKCRGSLKLLHLD